MSAISTERAITIEEFEQLPGSDEIEELLDGEGVAMPPPKQRHSALVKRTVKILSRYIDEPRIWAETGFLISTHCPKPDVAVIHADKAVERGWYSGAPLIAIEVASRGNTPDELAFKKELYLEHGAREVRLVYYKTRVNRTFRTPFYSPVLDAEIDPEEIFT